MIFALTLYLLIFTAIGIWSAFHTQNSSDFYAAGRSASPLSVTLSLLATILGSSAILGTISLSKTTGWASAWLMLCGSLGLLLLIPLTKFIRRHEQFTLPDLLEKFYGIEMKRLACLMIPVAWIGVIAAQIIGSAKVISFITPLSYTTSALTAGFLFTTYTMLGGQVSIIKTDRWQGLFILLGLTTAAAAALNSHGFSQTSLVSTFPFSVKFTVWDLLILILTYASVFLVGPDIYSRIFCAKNEKTATASVSIAAVLLAPVGFILAFIGTTGHTYSFDFLKTGVTPFIIGIGLFSALISSADTTLLTAATIFGELFVDLRERSSITLTRVLILSFGILSVLVALVLPNIIQSLMLAFSFFTGAFVIPTIAGLCGFKTSKSRAIHAALAGGVLALIGKIITLFDNNLGNALIVMAFPINALFLFSEFIFLKIKLKNRVIPYFLRRQQ